MRSQQVAAPLVAIAAAPSAAPDMLCCTAGTKHDIGVRARSPPRRVVLRRDDHTRVRKSEREGVAHYATQSRAVSPWMLAIDSVERSQFHLTTVPVSFNRTRTCTAEVTRLQVLPHQATPRHSSCSTRAAGHPSFAQVRSLRRIACRSATRQLFLESSLQRAQPLPASR